MLKQISVFTENKSGRLCAVMESLQGGGINIRAMTIADTAEFGILRLVVDDTDRAAAKLKADGFTVKVSDVIGFTIADKPGALYGVVQTLAGESINIEYSYSLMGKDAGKADIVVRLDDGERGLEVLKNSGVKLISIADL